MFMSMHKDIVTYFLNNLGNILKLTNSLDHSYTIKNYFLLAGLNKTKPVLGDYFNDI